MMNHPNSISQLLMIGIFSGVIACSSAKICKPGDVRECPCGTVSDQGIQICETNGIAFSPCACSHKTGEAAVSDHQSDDKASLPDDAPIVFALNKPIPLPAPRIEGGKPLMLALNDRLSSRKFSADPLDRQTLGDLLWAAWGINRKDVGKRTAPSAMNWQEMELYVALEQGLFVYDAAAHALVPKIAGDIRAETGKQPFVGTAPVNLVFVSDLSKMGDAPVEKKRIYAGAHGGFASQNVYLFCASFGLATVVRAYFDPVALKEAMGLKENQFISLAQTVGHHPV